ncbi:MAG TPA: PorV/PorQ family protein [Gemmatimonadales bacterium]|nr:PorV/PorQ family protein [Gemmatimonadales bacterium]
MRNRSVMIALGLLVAGTSAARAQGVIRQIESDNTAYGTTAAEFLLVPASARGAALGGGFAAIVTDVSSVHYNPAGLALMPRPGLLASQMNYVADTRYSWLAIGMPFSGGSRAIGLSVTNFGFSDQPVYTVEDPQGELGEVYSVSQTALGFTYSQQFSDRFSAGMTFKFINDRLGDVVGRAFAVDFGTSFRASVGGRPIRAAFVIQNLGSSLRHEGSALDVLVNREPPLDQQDVPQEPARARLSTKEWSLPVIFRVSMAYDLFATQSSRFSVLGEFTQPNNTEPAVNFAGEYSMNLGGSGFQLAGRLGWTTQPDNNLDPAGPSSPNYAGFESTVSDGSDGLSAGGGLRWQRDPRGIGISFDYAYRHLGVLGSVNMITVGLNW